MNLPRDARHKIYSNSGNSALLDLVDASAVTVLDVGCGTGANASLLRQRNPSVRVYGISASESEAAAAREHVEECWIADLETGFPSQSAGRKYDVILFSHVLEHLRRPGAVVQQGASLLRVGGSCVIAVPNVLAWAQRVKFAMGSFVYEESGVMDNTHLRFFTFETAAKYLLGDTPSLRLTEQEVTGAVPLWLLRRHLLPRQASQAIDRAGCRLFPNLFGSEVLLKAVKHT